MSEILDLYYGAPKGDAVEKALSNMKDAQKQQVEPKSAIIDPFNVMSMTGTRAKPTPIPYQTLRAMAEVPAISAIILTRLNQVARFTRRPRYDGDVGFRIVLKDKERKMSDVERKRAFEIEEFILKTGNVRNKKRKDNFNTFVRKLVRDSLTLDALVFENVPNLKGDLAELWAVDAATIEIVVNHPIGVDGDAPIIPVYIPETRAGIELGSEDIAYVQKINGQVIAEYSEDELAYAVRNPRTDIMMTDFGYSELETLIEIVTGILNGVRYNTSYFSHSHLPQGVLELVGKYKDEHLQAFKRHWKTLTSGASGKWSVPVMGLEDGQGFKFTPFKQSNRDMEFNQFLEFLFNIACAVYQIDPNEVGFKSWSSGGSNGGSTYKSDNTEAKIDSSQDKGFLPLMYFLSDTFNSEIVDRIDEDFCFEWVGVDEEDADKKLEREEKELNMGKKTVNEIRVANDMEPIEAAWAEAPANAQLIQVFMADKNAEMQQQQMEQQAQMQGDQADKDFQNQQQAAQDDHGRQMEVMDKQHQQNMESKQADQEHQTNLAKFQGQQQGKLADKQHGHTLEQKQADQEHQSKLEEFKAKQQGKMADKQHGSTMEQKGADHEHQEKMADKQARTQQGVLDKQHNQTLEQKKADQEHQINMHDRQTKTQDGASDKAHQRAMESKQADQKHQITMHERQAKLQKEAAKQGGKLKKSFNEPFEVTFEWDDY